MNIGIRRENTYNMQIMIRNKAKYTFPESIAAGNRCLFNFNTVKS